MTEFTSKSGAKIVINKSSFEVAQNLWSAIQRAAAQQNLSIDSLRDPNSMVSLILKIDSYESFKSALWPCLIRCTRNDRKIEKSTFDDADALKEYYQIVFPCVEENVGPFVESLFSAFGERMNASEKPPEDTLKST